MVHDSRSLARARALRPAGKPTRSGAGPPPPPTNEVHSGDCFGPAGLAMTAWRKRVCWRRFNLLGGPSWTRTTDLTLIRGALSPPELRAHTVNGKLYGEYSRASG